MSTFEEANQHVHAVETQWHYPILTAAGFIPATKEAIGFVRTYVYAHPDGRSVKCTTGTSSDYWRSSDGVRGLWSDLKPYCDS